MKRMGFSMQLKEGALDEYRRVHADVWPELLAAFQEAGILDYAIFYDDRTRTLFASQVLTDVNSKKTMGQTELMRRWWEKLAHLMEVNADLSPTVYPLDEVFSFRTQRPETNVDAGRIPFRGNP
ncbi:MAG: hypothetical protein A3J97_02265 [Spirochaetes bacterium RIFOXYC1_FULL_54_7]|nr:MAG: hypothetical protein A3J97_02265 [Spirochaetes bacterium RIFOXYC1_FULL_54_7]